MGFQKLALTVSEYVSKMSEALSERLDNINFPTTTDEIRNIKINFYQMAQFPNVLDAVDETLIPIIAPRENENVCRKGFHSLDIQAVVVHEMKYIIYLFLSATHLSNFNME